MKGAAESHQQLAAKYGQNCHSEVCMSRLECLNTAETVLLIQTGNNAYPHPQTSKTWSVLKQ
jgi:hypothetical protein